MMSGLVFVFPDLSSQSQKLHYLEHILMLLKENDS